MHHIARVSFTILAVVLTTAVCLSSAGRARAGEWEISGPLAGEVRVFPVKPLFPDQQDAIFSPSLSFEPEVTYEWNDGKDRLTLVPFGRLDAYDDSRTHVDLREANWLHIGDGWNLRVGFAKVFWGVAESVHLVDIINQTDFVEDVDGEDKLGQPMVNLNLQGDWGALSLFVLPGFRERTFPGADARLRGPLPIESDNPAYEPGLGPAHVDFAARWSRTFGDWDVGVSHFHGIGREPTFDLSFTAGGKPVLIPRYSLIDQTGLDVQLTTGAWLWKLEALTRGGQGDRFAAAVGGFEYTFYQIADSNADLGLLAEYLYDGRGITAPPTFADNDIFIGTRLALNDIQDTAFLAGAIVDHTTGAGIVLVEAERRLGNRWKIELEARLFLGKAEDIFLSSFRDDDYLTLRLSWYI